MVLTSFTIKNYSGLPQADLKKYYEAINSLCFKLLRTYKIKQIYNW